ncbi:acyl-coenzyme A synthetase ACSM3, mitochondrial-like isoform X3 [Erythrolamprus reginae]|uniref:acyl-coenzyme A synthetase ACSM3, mitochondrial-like isoform X3 n=1 Tax=Erythrolamprus reginae TaxID=121349 RepID=UPI00396CE468
MVGAMMFLSRLPRFQFAGVLTFPCRFNSQTIQGFASLASPDSEPQNRDVPEYFNFVTDVIDKWSQREKEGKRPSNPALWWVTENDEEAKWTFEELSYLSRKTANVLSEACNLCKGDRLLIILPRIPEWWFLSLACIRIGIVFIPATILLTAPDILYRLQQSKVSCIVGNEAVAPLVDAVGSECSWLKTRILVSKTDKREGWLNFHDLLQAASDQYQPVQTKSLDPMTVYFTSGTMGYPKMVQHSHGSLGFGMAITGRYRFKSLQACFSGGEPSNLDLLKEWKAESGCDIHEGYGQTEASILCGTGKGTKIKPGFFGKPLSGIDVQIIDENNNRLPPGEEGDIAVKIKPKKPVGLFSGYMDDPEKTSAMERGDYYITGDRGLMDEDGYIQFIARADDIILSSGYRIGPFEVEHALMKHPAVTEAAVVSSPDPIRGEVVKAFIILTPAYQSHDRDKLNVELQEHVKKITAPYKYPRKIEFVQDLPKTISGKIQKKLLRKKEWETA